MHKHLMPGPPCAQVNVTSTAPLSTYGRVACNRLMVEVSDYYLYNDVQVRGGPLGSWVWRGAVGEVQGRLYPGVGASRVVTAQTITCTRTCR